MRVVQSELVPVTALHVFFFSRGEIFKTYFVGMCMKLKRMVGVRVKLKRMVGANVTFRETYHVFHC